MRSLRLALAAAIVPLFVAACSVEVDDGNGGPTARTITDVPIGDEYQDLTPISRTIPGGGSASFQFDTSTADGEAIFFVLSEGDLYVENSDLNVIASSSVPEFFAAGTEGIIPVGVTEQALGAVNTSCIGACVILDTSQAPSRVWATIENPFGTAIDAELYVFSQRFDDVSEPQNDLRSGADLLIEGGMRGALESIGDVDHFEVDSNTPVTVSAPDVPTGAIDSDYLAIQAAVVDASGNLVDVPGDNPVTIVPDDSYTFDEVFPNEFIRIRAADADRAGPSPSSDYTIFPSF